MWLFSLFALKENVGKTKSKPKFNEIFSKSQPINILSAARMFLFGARDVWFVVALPVFLATSFNWEHWWVGGFMATWVIGYGLVQSIAPLITGSRVTREKATDKNKNQSPSGSTAFLWASYLTLIPVAIALALHFNFYSKASLIIGLLIFGVIFAINSSLHSYLIISYADKEGVSLDVGFYYMANAMGRLIGTVLSGFVYQAYGLEACLWISSVFIAIASLLSLKLPKATNKAITLL